MREFFFCYVGWWPDELKITKDTNWNYSDLLRLDKGEENMGIIPLQYIYSSIQHKSHTTLLCFVMLWVKNKYLLISFILLQGNTRSSIDKSCEAEVPWTASLRCAASATEATTTTTTAPRKLRRTGTTAAAVQKLSPPTTNSFPRAILELSTRRPVRVSALLQVFMFLFY